MPDDVIGDVVPLLDKILDAPVENPRPTLVTVPVPAVCHDKVVPLDDKTVPLEPIASFESVFVALAYTKSPVAYVENPVPPFADPNTPVTPVVKGNPVTLVITPDDGVPSAGVTSVGDVFNTTEPVPVLVVVPVPPYATFNVPATTTLTTVPVAGVSPVDPKLIELTTLLETDSVYVAIWAVVTRTVDPA